MITFSTFFAAVASPSSSFNPLVTLTHRHPLVTLTTVFPNVTLTTVFPNVTLT